MASLLNILSMATFFSAIMVGILSPGHESRAIPNPDDVSAEIIEPNGVEAPEESPAPGSTYLGFLEQCSKSLTPDCGEEIFTKVFNDAKGSVSFKCCKNLIKNGAGCHNGLVGNIVQNLPGYAKNVSTTLPQSVKTWFYCQALITNA